MLKIKNLDGIILNTDKIILKDLYGKIIKKYENSDYVYDDIYDEEVYSVNYCGDSATIVLNKYNKMIPTTIDIQNLLEDSIDESWVIHNLATKYCSEIVEVLFTQRDLREKVKSLIEKEEDPESLKECVKIIKVIKKIDEDQECPDFVYYNKAKKEYEVLKTEEDFINMINVEIGIDDTLHNMFATEMVKYKIGGPVFYEDGNLTDNAMVVYEYVADDYFDGDLDALDKFVAECEME